MVAIPHLMKDLLGKLAEIVPVEEHLIQGAQELRSADRVDFLVAFIRWSGLRLLLPALEEIAERNVPVRVITTSYMGASEARAVERLAEFPNVSVKVSYDSELGYPEEYVFNEPELAVDGGFILNVSEFVPNPPPGDSAEYERYVEALAKWTEAGITSYEFTFSRGCFCPVEYVGPYVATVTDGTVASATYNGVDLLEIELLRATSYGERVLTVDEVFAEIARAILEADSMDVTYHPELGYPLSASIDWELQMADEEVYYTLSDLQSK